jgi:hypothetical protein
MSVEGFAIWQQGDEWHMGTVDAATISSLGDAKAGLSLTIRASDDSIMGLWESVQAVIATMSGEPKP